MIINIYINSYMIIIIFYSCIYINIYIYDIYIYDYKYLYQ